MAFAYDTQDVRNCGTFKVARGTYANGAGDTGGDIDTGLQTCLFAKVTPTGASASANANVVNESFPCTGTITIVTDANEDGIWEAWGY